MTGTGTDVAKLVADTELEHLRAAIQRREGEYLERLRALVDIDSGSYTSAGVDEVGRHVATLLSELGGAVEVRSGQGLGATVVGRFRGRPGAPRALVIGHMDTVFDEGTARLRPFRIEGERAFGPGVTDMKSGLLAGLYALAALRETAGKRGSAAASPVEGGLAWLPFEELVYVANPDEEIGSPASSSVIRAEAARANVCFVLECARENGDIVSSRKGVLDLRLTVRGRAAHAGVEPWKGRSAALEAAHKTIAVHELNGRWEGVTANVGVIRGGSRPNVVTEEAFLEIDLRSPTRDGLEAAEAAVREIAAASTVPDTSSEVELMGRHWPMEKLKPTDRLVEHALELAGRLGFALSDTATGGASDANTTAGMGVPTLDGLGPVGGNDHAPTEYLELTSIVPRVTLLAALLLATARDRETLRWGPTPMSRLPEAGRP
jgi:glutamate carboxypeptidase